MPRNTGRTSPPTKPLTVMTNPRAATWVKTGSNSGVFTQAKSDGGAFAHRPWWRRLLGR